MLGSYLTAALRNLVHNKLQAAINVSGLAIGFAVATLIALFIHHELTYDSFIPGHERVFRLSEIYNRSGTPPMLVDATLPKLAALLATDFPEIESIARLQIDGNGAVRVGNIEANEMISWVDPEFFKVMPLPVVAGNAQEALSNPNGAVLTESTAKKYFGSTAIVGRTLELNNHLLTVGAVIRDLPSNSHLDLHLLAPGLAAFSRLASIDPGGLDIDSSLTYFRLKPDVSVERLAEALPAFVKRHRIKQNDAPPGEQGFELKVTPISEIHLQPAGIGAIKPSISRTSLWAFGAIAVLVVLVSVINYVNLITSLSKKRAIEIGVRKVTGATRRELIPLFIAESTLSVVLAAMLAIGLLELALPFFNAYSNTTISFMYWRPVTLAVLLGSIGCAGVLAGTYPALVLSSLRAAAALKGEATHRLSSSVVRTSLVILQFSILIGMTLAAITIYRQTRFALHETLRVPTDEILQVWNGCEQTFKDQIAMLTGVEAAACATAGLTSDTSAISKTGASLSFRDSCVGYGYLDLYGFRPLAGRFFDRAHGADEMREPSGTAPNVVINETALHRLGYIKPQDAIGLTLKWRKRTFAPPDSSGRDFMPLESTIIGVVADFSPDGMRNKVEPQIYNVDPSHSDLLQIKLDGKHLPESVAAIDRLWSKLHPGKPISRIFLDQRIQYLYADVIRQGGLLAAFTALALLLASLGLYGLAAFTAQQRTKEIGIRKAMGAGTVELMRLLVWQFTKPVLWANLIAWPVAGFLMHRWLQGFAYRVDLEPWLFVASSVAALLIALLTVSAHCYLVARAKPVAALRYE